MSDDQNPLEPAVELFVYVPIGVAMFAKDTVPTFMKMFVFAGACRAGPPEEIVAVHHDRSGRGEVAVSYGAEGEAQAGASWTTARAPWTRSRAWCRDGWRGSGGPEPPAEETAPGPGRRAAVARPSETARGTAAEPTVVHDAPAAHIAPTLPIPGYDQLSASQVVERLEGLAAGELDAVRNYEVAHRNRSTILGKIAQLAS